MKFILLIATLFCFNKINAQTELEKIYAKDACDCIQDLPKDDSAKDSFVLCFQTALMKNEKLVTAECLRLYGDTTYESGYKLGTELTQKTMSNMIHSCDVYYHLMDSLRYSDYAVLNSDSVQQELNKINALAVDERDAEFLKQRGLLQFQLKNYEESMKDVTEMLKTDPDNVTSLFLKGWIHEINGEYDKSIECYERMKELTGAATFNIFIELVKRKKRESPAA